MHPLRRSQPTDAKWIVLDYGDVVAHIFTVEARGYYDLEGLWAHAETVDLSGLLAEAPVDDAE
jgi:ribosome-associated protein